MKKMKRKTAVRRATLSSDKYHALRKASRGRDEAAKFVDGDGTLRAKIGKYHSQLGQGKFDAHKPEGA